MFGGSLNDSSQPQNIFVRVFSWTWISKPMTGSYSAFSGAHARAPLPSNPIARSSA